MARRNRDDDLLLEEDELTAAFLGDETAAPAEEGQPVAAAVVPDEDEWDADDTVPGQLAVDVYETENDIIIQAMVAGVRPEELQINIAPEYVTISGSRANAHEVSEKNFLYKELYWGSFSRTIALPQQIEPDLAQAVEKHGLLVLRLPKLDKEKTYRIKIRSSE